ncbi:MAG: hypothetical protein AAF713_19095 [Pseudomonadota bacterium]
MQKKLGRGEIAVSDDAALPQGANMMPAELIRAAAHLDEAAGLAAVYRAADQLHAVSHGEEENGLKADIARDAERAEAALAERQHVDCDQVDRLVGEAGKRQEAGPHQRLYAGNFQLLRLA